MNTKTSFQAATDIAIKQLGLRGVNIRIKQRRDVFTLNNCWGIVQQWHDPKSSTYYYIIELQKPQPSLIQTLGHELYHIWEYENNVAPCESLCDAFGRQLTIAMGVALRCCKCQKLMTDIEAEESEFGDEFADELICDECYNTSGAMLATELSCSSAATGRSQ